MNSQVKNYITRSEILCWDYLGLGDPLLGQLGAWRSFAGITWGLEILCWDNLEILCWDNTGLGDPLLGQLRDPLLGQHGAWRSFAGTT